MKNLKKVSGWVVPVMTGFALFCSGVAIATIAPPGGPPCGNTCYKKTNVVDCQNCCDSKCPGGIAHDGCYGNCDLLTNPTAL